MNKAMRKFIANIEDTLSYELICELATGLIGLVAMIIGGNIIINI